MEFLRWTKITGVHLTCSTQRYEPVVVDDEQALTNDMWPCPPGTAAAAIGYRRITAMLRLGGWEVNRKRVERI